LKQYLESIDTSSEDFKAAVAFCGEHKIPNPENHPKKVEFMVRVFKTLYNKRQTLPQQR
jgi:hypothetical protein